MPKGSALDIVEYESEELGNDIGLFLSHAELKTIDARKCMWVTESKKFALEYGDAIPVRPGSHRIIAKDNYGGFLIQKY